MTTTITNNSTHTTVIDKKTINMIENSKKRKRGIEDEEQEEEEEEEKSRCTKRIKRERERENIRKTEERKNDEQTPQRGVIFWQSYSEIDQNQQIGGDSFPFHIRNRTGNQSGYEMVFQPTVPNYMHQILGIESKATPVSSSHICCEGYVYKIDTRRDPPTVVRCPIPGRSTMTNLKAVVERLNRYWDYSTITKTGSLLWRLNVELDNIMRGMFHWKKIHMLFQKPITRVGVRDLFDKNGKAPSTILSPEWIRKHCLRRSSVTHDAWPNGHQHVASEAADEIVRLLEQIKYDQESFWDQIEL